MRPCQNCGTPIENSAEYCEECTKLNLPTESERIERVERQQREDSKKHRRQQRIASGKQVAERRAKDAADQIWVARFLRLLVIPFLLIATWIGFRFGLDKFFLATLVESGLVLAWFGLLNFQIENLGIGKSTNIGAKPLVITFAVMWCSFMAFAILSAYSHSDHAIPEPTSKTPILQQFTDAVSISTTS